MNGYENFPPERKFSRYMNLNSLLSQINTISYRPKGKNLQQFVEPYSTYDYSEDFDTGVEGIIKLKNRNYFA